MELNRGRFSRSRLFCNSPRTLEISEFLKIVAADRGTVFLKNERSRTRIARFTGGRNIVGMSLSSGLVESALRSMDEFWMDFIEL